MVQKQLHEQKEILYLYIYVKHALAYIRLQPCQKKYILTTGLERKCKAVIGSLRLPFGNLVSTTSETSETLAGHFVPDFQVYLKFCIVTVK